MSDIAIKVDGVSKFYRLYERPQDRVKEALNPFRKSYHRKHYALRDIDLEIRKGEVLGIVGRNGCGKSTLLKVLTNVLQPNSGDVTVNGSVTALLELGAGFNPEFSGIENIKFYARMLGIEGPELEEKLEKIVAFAELGEYLDQPVKTYSSGMRGRLGFAVAAHVDPDILILDEVLAVGDELFAKKCYAVVREFINSNKTIILVSHAAQSIIEFCTRAILIENSRICAEGAPKDVIKEYRKRLFGDEGFVSPVEESELKKNVEFYDETLNLTPQIEIDDKCFSLSKRSMSVESKIVNVVSFDEVVSLSVEIKHNVALDLNNNHTGMTIVTNTGQRLAAIKFSSISSTHNSTKLTANFSCLLNEGLYSIIFSIVDKLTGEYRFFINDLFLFRVVKSSAHRDKYYRWAVLEIK